MPLGVGPRYAVHGRSELHVLGSARTKDQKGGGVRGRLSGTSTTELGDGRSRRLVVAAEVVREGGENGAVDEAARVGLESERKGLLGGSKDQKCVVPSECGDVERILISARAATRGARLSRGAWPSAA